MTAVPDGGLAGMEALYPFLIIEPAAETATGTPTETAGSVAGDAATGRARGAQPADGGDSAGGAEPADLLADLRRSTVEKAYDVIEVRRRVAERDAARIGACAADLAAAFAAGGRLLAFGNGGSSTDALDLASLFLSAGNAGAGNAIAGSGVARPLPAFALAGDFALVTALSNDVGFDAVFARQIAALGRPGDIAVGLSTSGNSPNLLNAFDEAHTRGLLTVGIAGGDGGTMAGLPSIDHLFVVASPSVHRIQEAQTTIYHVLWELTLAALAAGTGAGAITDVRATTDVRAIDVPATTGTGGVPR